MRCWNAAPMQSQAISPLYGGACARDSEDARCGLRRTAEGFRADRPAYGQNST